jgi:hypothetical protein
MEEGEVSGGANFMVFPAAVQLSTTKTDFTNGRITLSGEAQRVDPSRFEGVQEWYGFYPATRKPAYLVGGVPNQTITATITPQIHERVEVGERYDFVNKISRMTYRYQQKTGTPFTLTAITDASGRFEISFPAQEGVGYAIELRTTDDKGREALLRASAGGYSYGLDLGSIGNIILGNEGGQSFGSREQMELGDSFSATFRRGEARGPAGGLNRYLFYEGQRGIRHHSVQDSPVYQTTFSDRHIPSAVIGGVYFNGYTYVEAQYGPTIVFNPESRRLSIEVRSLQQAYEPGDQATVEVRVRDAQGRPVAAELNLSAVDEAVFAVRDFQSFQTEILGRLYQQVPSGIIRTYASHQYPPEVIEQGGRGGGGDGLREDFADIAHFGTIRTDSSGRATATFKLPDNLTSWRVTAYGLTKDLKAGKGSGAVVASLPFLVDVSLNDTYVLGDAPMARLRAFGTQLAAGAQVNFTIEAPSLGLDSLSVTSRAFEDTFVPLTGLVLGSHQITVKAKSGDLEDGLRREIRVLKARLTAPVTRLYEDVGPSTRIEGSKDDRTTVTFMDAGRGRYYALLSSLANAYGDRVDQALARVIATNLLREYFREEAQAPSFDASIYLRAPSGYAGYTQPSPNVRSPIPRPGGVSILPYADGDLSTTARVAALAPDLFGRDRLRSNLQQVASDWEETPERLAIALYGLAALDEPVLLKLQALESEPDLGWRGHLYLALGLHESGDGAGARRVLSHLLSVSGEQLDSWLRLRVGADLDDSLEATALGAILAAGLGEPAAESMMRYVRENQTTDILLYLDELQFLQKLLPRLTASRVAFTYTFGEESQQATLEKGDLRSVSLSPDERAGLRLDVKEGRLAVVARYAAPAATTAPTSPDVQITRTVSVNGQPASTLPPGTLVQVTLTLSLGPQAPDGCYQVTDHVPSGLKVVTTTAYIRSSQDYRPPPRLGPVIRPYLSDPQKISFCAGKGSPPITYYARVSERGDFVWEAAEAHNQRAPSVAAFSEALRISVE